MKKYYDYLKKIDKKRAEKISLDRYYDFKSNWSERFIKAKTKEERDAIHAEHEIELKKREDAINRNEFIDVELSIMKNNARALLFDCIIPYVLKVLKDYNGKPYGEKTQKAIKERLESETGCAVYFKPCEILIIPLNKNGYSYGSENNLRIVATHDELNHEQRKILINNRINGDFEATYCFSYDFKPYVQNVNATARQIYKAHDNAIKARNAFYKAVSDFNRLAYGNIKELQYPNNIYNSIF